MGLFSPFHMNCKVVKWTVAMMEMEGPKKDDVEVTMYHPLRKDGWPRLAGANHRFAPRQ
jgi:hypothetical protein